MLTSNGQTQAFAIIPGPPTEWIYVEARDVGELISFNHVRVQAPDQQGAYYAGRAAMDSANMRDETGHASGKLLNTYLIALH